MHSRLTILVAEDSEDEGFLLRTSFRKIELPTALLHVVNDGLEAVRYLTGEGAYADRAQFPFPDLFLTDIKMAKMGGFDVLKWMRDHPECRVVPTIVLSGSNHSSDVARAYELGAHAYLVKPGNFDELREILRDACRFWARCAKPHAVSRPGPQNPSR